MVRKYLSTRTGLRRYNVKPSNLATRYIKVTPNRADARALGMRYGTSYYVRKNRAWLVCIYGIARGAGDRSYAIVGEWVFHLKPKPTAQEIMRVTFEEFENAGYSFFRFGDQDRVSLQMGIMGIDFNRGFDLLTLEEYREALQAHIADLDMRREK